MSTGAPAVIDQVKRNLVGLKMPRALEILDVSPRAGIGQMRDRSH